MTIEQIERRLAHEFPGKRVLLAIYVFAGGSSSIDISCDGFRVVECRSINHAIESLKEKMAPVRIGHIEIEA